MRRAFPALFLCLLAAPAPGSADAATPEGMTRVGRLQGSASLGRNREVVGATVLVSRADEASHLIVTASDAKGQFRVDGLPDGDYRVEVRREGLEPVVKDNVGLRFPARAVIEVLMQPVATPGAADSLPPGVAVDRAARVSVRGAVAERGGEPLADVPLRFVRPDGLADPVVARSGEDGSFELPPLPAGRWRLQARVVGFLPIWATLEIGEDTRVDLSMVRQPSGYLTSPLELMPPERPIPPQHPLSPPVRPPVEPPAAPEAPGEGGVFSWMVRP